MKNKILALLAMAMLAAGSASAANPSCVAVPTPLDYSTGVYWQDPTIANNYANVNGTAWLTAEYTLNTDCNMVWDITLDRITGSTAAWNKFVLPFNTAGRNSTTAAEILISGAANGNEIRSNQWPYNNGPFVPDTVSVTNDKITISGRGYDYFVNGTGNFYKLNETKKMTVVNTVWCDLSTNYVEYGVNCDPSITTTTSTTATTTSTTSTTGTTLAVFNIVVNGSSLEPSVNLSQNTVIATVKDGEGNEYFPLDSEAPDGYIEGADEENTGQVLEGWLTYWPAGGSPLESTHYSIMVPPTGGTVTLYPVFAAQPTNNKTVCYEFVDDATDVALTVNYVITEPSYGETYSGNGHTACVEVKNTFTGEINVAASGATGYHSVSLNVVQAPLTLIGLLPIIQTGSPDAYFQGYVISTPGPNVTGEKVYAQDLTVPQTLQGVTSAGFFNITGLNKNHTYNLYTNSQRCAKTFSELKTLTPDAAPRYIICKPATDDPILNATLGSIVVTVSDPAGDGLNNVLVTLKCSGYAAKSLRTNGNGQVEFQDLHEGVLCSVTSVLSGYVDGLGSGYSGDPVPITMYKEGSSGGGGGADDEDVIIQLRISDENGTRNYNQNGVILGLFDSDGARIDTQTSNGLGRATGSAPPGAVTVKAESGCIGGEWTNDVVKVKAEGGGTAYLTCVMPGGSSGGGGGGSGSAEAADLSDFVLSMVPLFKIILFFLFFLILMELVKRMNR